MTPRAPFLAMAVFALQPVALGAWLALIPRVQAALGLGKADLALALLGMPVATVLGLQLASRALTRWGPRRVLRLCFGLQLPILALPLVAPSQGALFAVLLLAGLVMAFMQVSLNVYAGRLEKQSGQAVMSRCHGFWALGLMAGSFAVPLLLGAVPLAAYLGVATPAALAGVVASTLLPRLRGEVSDTPAPPRRRLRQIPGALVAISLFALAVAMLEGAMADWGAIYMAERLGENGTRAGWAVSLYAGFLALGRLLGDTARRHLGLLGLARASLALAIAGLLALILPLPLGAAWAGFALVGLGASVGYPLAVSAAAALSDLYESANIAFLSTIAMTGFLLGPPLIGFVADAASLRAGFAVLLPGLLMGLALARALNPRSDASQPG